MTRADCVVRGAIASFEHAGHPFQFFVNDDRDIVQRCHRQRRFYEVEELQIIASRFRGGCFVDVGSNVGNHAIYAARILNASKVIAFEPNDLAARILTINVELNGLEDFVEIHNCGLADRKGGAELCQMYNSNLGAARLVSADGGQINLERGDDLLRDVKVDFIKIDSEGFEIDVLAGLTETLERDRPDLFVEVEDPNLVAFHEFCGNHGYDVRREHRRYATATNFLAIANDPREGNKLPRYRSADRPVGRDLA